MLNRFERPAKIICLALAAVLLCQLGVMLLSGDPLAHLKIPALPSLPSATNEPAKADQKESKTAAVTKTGTNGTNATLGAKVANGTNAVSGTNVTAKSTNTSAAGEMGSADTNSAPKKGGSQKPTPSGEMAGLPPGVTPEMLASLPPEIRAQMMGGGMPGGRRGGGMKKIELPPEIQARVDRIVESELFGPIPRPMPMALIGLSDEEAFIQATNGQTGPVKVGGELGGIKLLRIGLNRVLVEQDGEKKELTLFGGLGGESLLPKSTNEPSTNAISTNASSTNAPAKRASKRKVIASIGSTNQTLSSKQKEIP